MKKTILLSVAAVCGTAILIAVIFAVYGRVNNNHDLTLYGNVDVRQVDIAFRVSGKVKEMHVQEGDSVKKGMLLCTLEEDPYDSLLGEAVARAASVASELANADLQYQRRMEVVDSGAISGENFVNSRSKVETLTASLVQAEKAVLVAKDNLSYTKVYAPTDAVVLSRIREPGTVVNVGVPVYTLSVTRPVWIRAFVDEPNLGRVHYGMNATVYTDVKGGKPYKAKVGFISPMAEFTPKSVQTTQLRTDLVYRLRVYIDDPDCQLVQGMPVTVKLHLER